MNVVARTTLAALAELGVSALPAYARALACACKAAPPPYGKKRYARLYGESARNPDWVALTLGRAAEGEGDAAKRLWNLAACTPDTNLSRQIQLHAIDEARHSRAYVTLLDLVFTGALDEGLRSAFRALTPGYTKSTPLVATPGSPYAHAITIDELVQMNIAEIRTRVNHCLQWPVLLAFCGSAERARIERILASLLIDETRHIAYTAVLIEEAAQACGNDEIVHLMCERMRDFNEITEAEIAGRVISAA